MFRKIKILYTLLKAALLKKKIKSKDGLNNVNIIVPNRNSGLGNIAISLKKKVRSNFKAKKINFYSLRDLETQKIFIKKDAINIIVGNPDIVFKVIQLKTIDILKASYNIGAWFWELEKPSFRWYLLKNIIHESWVLSEFNLISFKKIFTNVKKVKFYRSTIKKRQVKKFRYFTFFFTFDYNSYIERKNPKAVIDAFKKAFPEEERVSLILKTRNSSAHKDEHKNIIKHINKDNRIILMNQNISHDDYEKLLNKIDCYVSLHRSEGFGLTIYEALNLGKYVIATSYSGNMEYTNSENSKLVAYKMVKIKKGEYPHSRNQYWANPDIDQAAKYMKELYARR